jgi:hypothetical protein
VALERIVVAVEYKDAVAMSYFRISVLCFLFCARVSASDMRGDYIDSLGKLRVGMTCENLRVVRPQVETASDGYEVPRDEAAKASRCGGEMGTLGEGLPENHWFRSALYVMQRGKLDSISLTGDRRWKTRDFLGRRRGVLRAVSRRLGPPDDAIVDVQDLPGKPKSDVPLFLWRRGGTLWMLMLPTPGHGRFAYMTYGLQAIPIAREKIFLKDKKPLSVSQRKVFFHSVGIDFYDAGSKN